MDNIRQINVIYDDKYLGEGYFITYEHSEVIYKFLKIYISSNEGFPVFNIRSYEMNAKDKCEEPYRDIEIKVTPEKNPELYEILTKLNGIKIETIDKANQGENHLKVVQNKDSISLITTKNIFKGHFITPDFIDIVLGDNYTCAAYESILKFYKELGKISLNGKKEKIVSRLLNMK